MKYLPIIGAAAGLAILPASFADMPTPADVHQHVFAAVKSVRDALVPPPVIHLVETFPPVAIPRAAVLQLAQAPAGVPAPPPPPTSTTPPAAGAANAPVSDTTAATEQGLNTSGGTVNLTASPRPPAGLKPEERAVAEWANQFALATADRAMAGWIPNRVRKPLIVSASAKDPKTLGEIEEDLNVMMRILEKTSNTRDDSKAMGIDVFALGGSGSQRVFYIDGHGAMFLLRVRYPLLAPPAHDDQARTNESTNSEWEKARQEVYGKRRTFEEKFAFRDGPAEEFDADRVEKLKTQLMDDLANASHIRNLKSDDYVTIVVTGGGARANVVRHESRSGRGGSSSGSMSRSGAGSSAPSAGIGGGGGGGYAEVWTSSSDAGAQTTTMTLRAKKSDIDAFAKGKIKSEEFQKKVSVQIY